jgi:hypothetical protein
MNGLACMQCRCRCCVALGHKRQGGGRGGMGLVLATAATATARCGGWREAAQTFILARACVYVNEHESRAQPLQIGSSFR